MLRACINVKSLTGWSLYWEVITGQMQSLYDVQLCNLYSKEINLDDGRFERFSYHRQANAIELSLRFGEPSFNLPSEMVCWLEWLAEHSRSLWSFELEMFSLSQGRIWFSFDDVKDAIFFRLVFG